MTWIQTVSGLPADLLNLKRDQIDIEDIAYALAGLNRYTGHTRYNVAQHSVLCAMMAPVAWAYEALMHDAHEAYMGDVSAPMKYALLDLCGNDRTLEPLRRLDAALSTRVARRFNSTISGCGASSVRVVDLRMLQTERLQLHGEPPRPWNVSMDDYPPYDLEIEVWSPERSEQEFLSAFYALAPTSVLRDIGFLR